MSKPRVSYVDLPVPSRLNEYVGEGDFIDCVFAPSVGAHMSAEQLAKQAFGQMPSWITRLMQLRNAIVGLFGLKTGDVGVSPDQMPDSLKIDDKIGVFRVCYISEDEVILGDNDKHLDFRTSILKSDNGCILSTWVRTHNVFGKAYLAIIMPFHRLITQHTAKRLMVE
ncbi:DUF2867 domain-containing protein [Lentilitoribacter sp. Alg239-R112]|uniref:DUF2867 domain-containing protein n=1 Tax=Lentilitoribacter sp. Alg239-R112 TaxID=2305987 RepID=UPI0013A6C1D0|nr:DUF2867 domain-containing protein [Lentilitoribacter sp. Alg239-R112]